MSRPSNQRSSGGIGSWILPIFFLFFIPPVGVLLLVVKLFKLSDQKESAGRHPYYIQ